MSSSPEASAVTVATAVVEARSETYAYRRLGAVGGTPLLCLQHFTGTLDNWDPALIDRLAEQREVILFDNAGIGRSTGQVPDTVSAMAVHVLAFLDALGIATCDILGFSLGGMIAQEIALASPQSVRRMLLVATAPAGGEDIMHMDKPAIRPIFEDREMAPLDQAAALFFTDTEAGQAAAAGYKERLSARTDDRDPPTTPEAIAAQLAAFKEWESGGPARFDRLGAIRQPCLVINGVADILIATRNSYWLAENLPNAMLLTYPDAGHGSLFQYHASFAGIAAAFLDTADDRAAFIP